MHPRELTADIDGHLKNLLTITDNLLFYQTHINPYLTLSDDDKRKFASIILQDEDLAHTILTSAVYLRAKDLLDIETFCWLLNFPNTLCPLILTTEIDYYLQDDKFSHRADNFKWLLMQSMAKVDEVLISTKFNKQLEDICKSDSAALAAFFDLYLYFYSKNILTYQSVEKVLISSDWFIDAYRRGDVIFDFKEPLQVLTEEAGTKKRRYSFVFFPAAPPAKRLHTGNSDVMEIEAESMQLN